MCSPWLRFSVARHQKTMLEGELGAEFHQAPAHDSVLRSPLVVHDLKPLARFGTVLALRML